MSTFLDDVIQRTLGDALALQPRIPARFEPSLAAPALWIDSVPAEDAAQPGPRMQSPPPATSIENTSRSSVQPLSSFRPAPETPGLQLGAQPPLQAAAIQRPAGQHPAFAPGATDASSWQPQRNSIPPSPTSGEPQPEPFSTATRSAAPMQPMPKPPSPIEPAAGPLLPASPAFIEPVSGTGAPMAAPAVSVRVHIGRIEMQSLPQQPGPARLPPRAEQQRATAASLRPAHSLDEYLGRKGRRR